MIEIIINAERNSVLVLRDSKVCKGTKGSPEWCEMTAQRWAEQYGVESIIYESKINS